jgi:hypothetical protein
MKNRVSFLNYLLNIKKSLFRLNDRDRLITVGELLKQVKWRLPKSDRK